MANNGDGKHDSKKEALTKFQCQPYIWKGFLSSTVPTSFDLFNTKDVVKVSLGNQHTAFLTSEHSVYCLGSGEHGQLGHGKFTDVTKKPVLVNSLKGENVTDVVCGGDHTAVVCADGIVFCWGSSAKGQCATTEEKVNTPKLVTLSDKTCDPVVTQLSCGAAHTLALTNQGQVWAWGCGSQLGCGTGNNVVSTPQKLDAFCGRNVLKIACGSTYSMAIVQKIKTQKSPSIQSNETEEDGEAPCVACDEEAFTVHEEGDTLVVTDNHICIHENKSLLSSVKSISPDSLDVSLLPKEKSAKEDDSSSEGSQASQGTYTLEEKGAEKTQEEPQEEEHEDRETNVDEVSVSFTQNEDPRSNYQSEVGSSSGGRLPLDTSARQFLLKQLRPVKLVSSLPQDKRSTSKDKIFTFVPRMLMSGIERIVSPQGTFIGNLKSIVHMNNSSTNGRAVPSITMRNNSVSVETELSPLKSPYDDIFSDSSLQTEVWSWGRGTMGQLGQGDTLERNEVGKNMERPQPTIIKQLSAKGIINIFAGDSHCIAVGSNGQAFSWGASSDGQLGHTGQLVPKRIKMPGNSLIWGAALGSNHSLLLTDGPSFQPDVYYLGKQPSLQELRNEGLAPDSPLKEVKDSTPKKRPTSAISKSPTVKYAARAKQPEKLMFMRKCGWVQLLAARGDTCACVSDKNHSGYVSVLSELSATERLLHSQLTTIKSTVWKSLQSTDMLRLLENSIYLHPLRLLLDLFSTVSSAVGINSVHLTGIVQRNQYLSDLSLLQKAKDITGLFELYAKTLCDFVNLSGFKHLAKVGSEILQKHESTFMELLNKEEKLTDFGPSLRRLFQFPMDRVKSYAYLLGKLKMYFAEESDEHQLLGSSSELWEKVQGTMDACIADAEQTKAFWDSCPNKLAESLKRPDRRIIRDSRKKPLQVVNAGRLSTNWFLLFNDVFVHAQFTSHHIYSLSLVWAEPVPDTDQTKNALQLTMPEKTLLLHTNSQAEKAEWLWTINQTIDVILTAGKEKQEVKSPNGRVPPKLARPGRHTFANHPQGKHVTYEGMWLTGKPHGSGTLTWPDGRKYSGHLVNGLQNGFGWSIEPTADSGSKTKVYQGQWKDGKREGRGFLRYPNGDVYLGYFKDNQCSGNGILQCVNPASIYVGQWKKDCFHGYGVKDDSLHGEKYMGCWQDSKRNGDGFVITVDGVYYEGHFSDDKLQGPGILITEDGTCFQGQLNSGPTLNGKGTLTMPNGDFVEGSFNGLWGDEVKVNGTFSKFAEEGPPPSLVRMLGQNTVSADNKWLDIFSECWQDLGCESNKPDCGKAWTSVAAALAIGKRELEFLEGLQAEVDTPTLRKAIEELERIPEHNRSTITSQNLKEIENYLSKSFDLPIHPLGRLIENLVNAFRASYVGIGAHQLLLPYAIDEVKCFIKKTYEIVRILFPELPDFSGKPRTPVVEQTPTDFYYDYTGGDTVHTENTSGQHEKGTGEDISLMITPEGLLHPLLLPKLCPALLTMYAVKNADENERYLDRLNRLNRQLDMSLMAYLGIDQKFWLFDDAVYSEPSKLKELKDVSYLEAIHALERISTAFSPADKLGVIESTMEAIDLKVQSKRSGGHVWSMDDLFPLFQYVVTRARIPHLGSEIQFIEDLMDPGIIYGRLGILMTTLKACYVQICNENLKAL
ncbi:Alsin [Holothuria leucospilota]|uniref:Alsin n=1 Tax=Holothuria leucospilota TaxID=206669 RepID=A0A9Q0YD82_HOLLE|nr:Alsin [Holothuria leucospilota]